MVSSSDGFCSSLSFAPGELGEVYKGEIGPPKLPAPSPAPPQPSASSSTPQPHRNTPTSTSSFAAPSPARPQSPTRSNSASSVATQSSMAQGVKTNPTLVGGSVPGIAAANSAKVTGVPMTTPPETPGSSAAATAAFNAAAAAAASTAGSGAGAGAAGSPASTTGTKRDASESEREEGAVEPKKKRRIAPTVVENP